MSVTPIAPDSGRLFQQELASDPFWMLVACILINRTHWRQVKPVLERLRATCKDARGLVRAPIEDVLEAVKPLGLHNRRASVLRRFALDWTDQAPRTGEDVMKMTGCGEYAAQSWMIFVEHRLPRMDRVTDNKLMWYVNQVRKGDLVCGQ